MGKIGKCCCCPVLSDLPDIILGGMTGGSWANFGGNICCWERVYTYDEEQDFELIRTDVIEEFDSDITSVVEWLKYKQTPFLNYKLTTGETCPEEEEQPAPYDCGTYVKVATTTTRRIEQNKTRHRFYIKKRDVTIRITRGNVSCDEELLEKWVVSIQYRFWSRLGVSQWGGGTGYLSTEINTVFETCFAGTMPSGWLTGTSSSGSASWGTESAVDTERLFVKTKTYTDLPADDTWAAEDANSEDCYMICSFGANSEPAEVVLQSYVAPTYGSCAPSIITQRVLNGYTWDPCVLPATANCSSLACLDCEAFPPTYTRSPGPTIDCSTRVYDRYYVSGNSCTVNTATITPTNAPIEYACGTCDTSATCAEIPDGWFQANVGEACKYTSGTINSQVSLSITFLDVEKRDLVVYEWPTLFIDFNL